MSTFIEEAKQTRTSYVNFINSLEWNTELRTKAEDILIMYDQMVDKLTLFDGKTILSPTMDKDGYPTEDTLYTIANWPLPEDKEDFHMYIEDLLEFIKGAWTYDSIYEKKPFKRKRKVIFITCGWSGNESIIYAFQKSIYWGIFWKSSERGGKYVLEFPVK